MRISDWSSDVCSSDLLENALCAHLRLIVEDAAEMLAVRKNLCLIRQVRPTRINQINAWQPIFRRDFLRAQVLFYRQRIIGAAFHRRIVADDHDLSPRYAANARNDSRAGHFAVVPVAGGKLAAFQEGRTRVEQARPALAGPQLAPGELQFRIPPGTTMSA